MITLYVVRKTIVGDGLEIGDICLTTEEMWNSYHESTLVSRPDGKEFWYNKNTFKTLEQLRGDKLNDIL